MGLNADRVINAGVKTRTLNSSFVEPEMNGCGTFLWLASNDALALRQDGQYASHSTKTHACELMPRSRTCDDRMTRVMHLCEPCWVLRYGTVLGVEMSPRPRSGSRLKGERTTSNFCTGG